MANNFMEDNPDITQCRPEVTKINIFLILYEGYHQVIKLNAE